jgi:hypothetical protein
MPLKFNVQAIYPHLLRNMEETVAYAAPTISLALLHLELCSGL